MKKLFMVTLLLCCAGCEQHPELTPLPQSVAPAVVAQGQERYVVITGENFTPTLSWKSAGGAGVDASFLVQFGNQPGVDAWPASTTSLTARLPKNLPAGSHSVVVQGPGGQAGQRADALCVDDQPFQELIHACLMDLGEGIMDICSTSLDGGYHKKTVINNAVPGIAQGAGTNQTESLWNGFTLSPNGRLLVFLRWTPDQTRLRLILYQFSASGSGTEITLDEVEVPGDAENPFRLLSPPVFSPDSRQLVYVKNNRRLMRQEVPDKIGPLDDPVLLAEEPEPPDTQVNIVYPDIDPAMRFVLYTRVVEPKAKERSDMVSLHLVPLSGGVPHLLLEEDPQRSKNGPGTFLPGGEGVVFISDRLNLQIPTPFGAMTSATNLYRVSLYGGPVEPLGNPTAAYLYGKPVVSPDGRFVATTGFLADVSGSGLDIMLTNLQNGQVTRVLEDPVRYCIPEAVEDCADPVNPREWVLPCCADPANSATCCGIFGSGYCPTWDVGPAFTPDSRALYANGLAIQWVCTENVEAGYWGWQGRIANVFLYKAAFSEDGQTTELETLPYGLLDMPLGPLVRQTVTCR